MAAVSVMAAAPRSPVFSPLPLLLAACITLSVVRGQWIDDLGLPMDPQVMSDENIGLGSRAGILNLLSMSPTYRECFLAPPACPSANVSFYLYSSDNPSSPYKLDPSKPETVMDAKIKAGLPIKVLVHGYTGHRDYSPNLEVRPEYLKMSGVHVISVDYGPLVRPPCYVWATYNVAVAANCTAQLIDMMVARKDIALDQFHVVGFSLGAQVAGIIANYLQAGQLKRITGLDPALPLFFGSSRVMLDRSDAVFVDVVHTNAGRRGKLARVGHLDFYVNGGTNQPGCEDNVDGVSSCSHVRAPLLFGESVHSTTGFWGFPCSGLPLYIFGFCRAWDGASPMQLMGEYASNKASGMYVVLTNATPPYAKGYKSATLRTPLAQPTVQKRTNS